MSAPVQPGTRWLPDSVFPELTPFERHVAMLLVEDQSAAVIGRRLDVSRGTVSSAKYKLIAKLQLEGLAGLTRLAIRRGYIEP